jgi:hypothetical protein
MEGTRYQQYDRLQTIEAMILTSIQIDEVDCQSTTGIDINHCQPIERPMDEVVSIDGAGNMFISGIKKIMILIGLNCEECQERQKEKAGEKL